MRIWRYSRLDAILVLLALLEPAALLGSAASWTRVPYWGIAVEWLGATLLMTYNLLIVCHFFTHTPWFTSRALNCVVSAVASVNAGQSMEAYRSYHLFNHHEYNNDRKDAEGRTCDESSTFRHGHGGEHERAPSYCLVGAARTIARSLRAALGVHRLWRIGRDEQQLVLLTRPERRAQIRADRCAQFLGLGTLLAISWQWTVLCYLPAWYAALALVNLQNYFEHYGASPEREFANAVSYYGRIYNLLTFHDGYHQEHHLRPGAHWRTLPDVRARFSTELAATERVISRVPAIFGFLDRRPLLHRRSRDADDAPGGEADIRRATPDDHTHTQSDGEHDGQRRL